MARFPTMTDWQVSFLIEALHREFDVSPCATPRISLMRGGYSGFTHRTVVSQPLGQSSDVHGSDARQPPKIPRRDVRRTVVERANRCRVMVSSRRRGSGPARKVLTAPSERGMRRSVPTESNDGGRRAFRDRVLHRGREGLRSSEPAAPWGESAQPDRGSFGRDGKRPGAGRAAPAPRHRPRSTDACDCRRVGRGRSPLDRFLESAESHAQSIGMKGR
jgi:hypothetical protein